MDNQAAPSAISAREYFAGLAMSEMLAVSMRRTLPISGEDMELITATAWKISDKMIEAGAKTQMDALKKLMSKCKCGVYVTVNMHRDNHESVGQWIEDQRCMGPSIDQTSAEVLAEMMRLDTVVEVQFYPDTPVSFFRVVHYDLDAALAKALECFDGDGS